MLKIYVSKETGSYYWMHEGELMACPMNRHSGIVELGDEGGGDSCAVDWYEIDGETMGGGMKLKDYLYDVERKLKE